ncbi:MAG: pyruvate kinase [Candidatus Gracilibacteria bacterium]|nr:pyruvate kinase [Candidatus Gracilibacteria bacterium]
MYTKNTKIVCTLGPSSDSFSEITNLIHAGMNVARLNFSHGSYAHHLKIIKNLRKAEKQLGRRIAILQDLQGPKIRLGILPEEGIQIKKGEKLTITTEKIIGERNSKEIIIPIQYKEIVKDAKAKDVLLINDGIIEIKIEKVIKNKLFCRAKTGGLLKSNQGVNSSTASISAKPITEKDKKDLEFGLKNNVDYVALSFVRSPKDIEELRKLITKHKKDTKIVAKIERHEAVKNLEKIIQITDAVMVARGDLGIDIPAAQVPIVQKRMIALANKYAKPVITATQVLQSMVENPIATRAEISDAANAVFDSTDAIMLSNESAVGKYPFKSTATLSKVAITVEKEMERHPEILENIYARRAFGALNATCANACELAKDTSADFIVVYTKSGYTARHVAKYRPFITIITITENESIARELCLTWGLNKIFIHNIKNKGMKKTEEIISFLKKIKKVKKGQRIVIVGSASEQEKIISTYKI